ncbi:rhamnosyltransferase WsaF family glycosyltransferase [Dankookia rubra]|uniref:rhamnosyltransferase WsaF family glycosyltransferase n=1 Tax=Dankookia rubra TaxID=1442381 RepID=UPI0019D4FE1A|nr:class I SAM-dependent methyltransferase [Dankookia rubra]
MSQAIRATSDSFEATDKAATCFLAEPSFWFPDRLVPSAWLEHAPFGFWIVAAARPRMLVELGSHHGFSYLVFCQAIQRLGLACQSYAIDSWAGDAHTGTYSEEVFAALQAYHEPRYSSFSSLIRTRFDEALSQFDDGSIDLLHIDGQHRYEDVRHDYEAWRPKLSDRAIVLFHDVNVRESDFGVVRFWEEMRQRYPSFAFQHGSGLGVLGVGTQLPNTIAEFFRATSREETAVAVSLAYSRLGAAVTAQHRLEQQAATLAQLHSTAAVNEQLRSGKILDMQQTARLRAEVVTAKASEGKAVAAVSRLTAEARRLFEEAVKRDQVIQAAQQDIADLRSVLAEREAALASSSAEREAILVVSGHQAQVLQGLVDNARNDADDVRKTALALGAELAAMRGSAAWRLAAPALRLAGIDGSQPYVGLMGRLRLRRDRRMLSRSPLFDHAWYLQTYPDVVGTDPIIHFLCHGTQERRNPGPRFDTATYLARRPDVAAARVNPLVHFLRAGYAEQTFFPVAPGVIPAATEHLLPSSTAAPTALQTVAHVDPEAALISPTLDAAPAPTESSLVPSVIVSTAMQAVTHVHPEVASTPTAPATITMAVEHSLAFSAALPTTAQAVAHAFPEAEPFLAFSTPTSVRPRVTMVADNVDMDTFDGNISTGLVLATLLAERLGGDLRLLTRKEASAPDRVREVLHSNGVNWAANITFECAPIGDTRRQVDVTDGDRFISTSWPTTRAMLNAVGPKRVTYLVQEDERLFSRQGDERLRCAELLAEPELRMAVNSSMLFDHLRGSGVADLPRRACVFEPAIPFGIPDFAPRLAEKLNFFFDARSNRAPQLYLRGLEVLAAAIEDRHLDPDRWVIHFVGGNDRVALPRGMEARVVAGLSRSDYVQLVKRMDAGLCLTYAPHPSVTLLELAMCGAAVVTNRWEAKTSLERYSDNIFCVEPDVASLSTAIGDAVALAVDVPRRRANQEASTIGRDWRVALAEVLDRLAKE